MELEGKPPRRLSTCSTLCFLRRALGACPGVGALPLLSLTEVLTSRM